MKRICLIGVWVMMCLGLMVGSPVWAKKDVAGTSHKHVTHTRKKSSHKKTSHKKRTASKKDTHGVYYIKPPEENLRRSPSGQKLGLLSQGAPVTVKKIKGNWALVTVRAWIWKPSLTKTKPKTGTGLQVGKVRGSFKGHGFVIQAMLENQTKAVFSKVVLQGELFSGKRRVAYKTLSLFSSKKPLRPGRRFPFSISFKRTRGFDAYSVRIVSARHR